MRISGARTVAEFLEIRRQTIQTWIDQNFESGSVTWEYAGANAIVVTDTPGDSITVSLNDIN